MYNALIGTVKIKMHSRAPHSHNGDHSQLDDHHHHKYIIITAIITITTTAGDSNDDAGAQQCHGQDFTHQAMNKIGLGSGRDKIVCERLTQYL